MRVHVVPDEMVVTFGVETFDKNLQAAKRENAAAGSRLVPAMLAQGVEERDLRTSDVRVQLSYTRQAERRELDGYVAVRTYELTLRDPKRLEQVIDAVITNGGNEIHGIEYRTTELRRHRDEARALAIRAAREKAVLLARELQCTIGAPRTITEREAGSGFNPWQTNNMAQVSRSLGATDPGGDGGDSTPVGQISVRANVSVTFDLIAESDNQQ